MPTHAVLTAYVFATSRNQFRNQTNSQIDLSQTICKKINMKHIIIALSLGAISSLSMAPHSFPPALFIGLSGLYILLTTKTSRKAASIAGFAFSFGYFMFSLSWIGNALLIEDNPYWWVWPFAVAGLPLILSLFTAITCYLYKCICAEQRTALSFIVFICLIFITEYARGHLFTGFPWNLYGYTWISVMPIAQAASLYNIYLLTFLTILWASIWGYLIVSKEHLYIRTLIALLTIATFACSYLYGHNRINTYKPTFHDDKIAVIVQPNIKQSEKWKRENRTKNFLKLIELSKYKENHSNQSPNNAYYIIWPETAISQDLINSPWVSSMIAKLLQNYPGNATLITGALRYNDTLTEFQNSVILYNNEGEITNTYDKSHLVPFGEYMPLEDIINIAPIVGFSGFKKGNGPQAISLTTGITALPLICYEIIFPEEIPTTNIDFFINVTNDAWYGDSAGPRQHLVQTQFRSIETGIPILRSANTGISAIINPLGYSTHSAVLNKDDVLQEKIPISFAK